MDAMLTTKQVCKKFQVTPTTIRRWINLSIFPRPLKIGATVRFRETDVEAFVTSGWLEDRPGRHAGFASGWMPDQDDVGQDELGTAADIDGD